MRLKAWREKEADFLRQTGRRQDSSRSQVGGFGHSQASKATWKVQNFSREKRSDEVFVVFPPMKGDAIKAQSIYKELQKSEVGKHTYQFIVENNIPVEITYTTECNPRLLGRVLGKNVEIYAINTKTIKKTATTIIHECKHIELSSAYPTQWEEIQCFTQERLHEKGFLTEADEQDILDTVLRLYPDLPWR